MKNNLYIKIQKGGWRTEDFGRGKSQTSKKRHRRAIKRSTRTRFIKIIMDQDIPKINAD